MQKQNNVFLFITDYKLNIKWKTVYWSIILCYDMRKSLSKENVQVRQKDKG